MALVGDSGALRDAINACQNAGGPNDYADQAHHLLSSNVIIKLDAEYGGFAEKSEYDLNRGTNGILLPTLYGFQMHHELQRHCGGHSKEFYALVRELVLPTYDDNDGPVKPCPGNKVAQNILSGLTKAEKAAKKNIKSIDWELYEHSKVLFDRDYRDEGVGDLEVIRRAFTDKASGLDWLDKKAPPEIMRRYEVVKKKEVVRKQFYVGEGYPSPGTNPRK